MLTSKEMYDMLKLKKNEETVMLNQNFINGTILSRQKIKINLISIAIKTD